MAEDTEAVDAASKLAVSKWLNTVISAPQLHWATIVLGSALAGSTAKTGVRYVKIEDQVISAVLSMGTGGAVFDMITGANSEVAGTIRETARISNAIAESLKDPNIEGIPISAETESTSRDVEVNKQIVVVQSAGNNQVVVDNATPQLKQWKIKGYLTAASKGLDAYLTIKPSLLLQRKMLDWYATSRRPVWFKTHDCEFHKVLISHIDTQYDANALNAIAINVTLTEFKTLEAGDTTVAALLAKKE